MDLILDRDDCRAAFLCLVSHPKTHVIMLCRMAPSQKAHVVNLVKTLAGPNRTLAVGDGVNDVSMLRAAHVGVGLYGHDGRQAVENADFAIPRFKHVLPLLLVHGRQSYKRAAKLIGYCIYKNLTIITIQLLAIYYNKSCQPALEQELFNPYNVLYTSLPILCVATLGRELEPSLLLTYPELHRRGIRGTALNLSTAGGWVGLAIFHGYFLYITCFEALHDELDSLFATSFALFTCLLIAVNAKLLLLSSWTWHGAVAVAASLITWLIYGGVLSSSLITWPQFYRGLGEALGVPRLWLTIPLIVWTVIWPDLCWLAYRRNYGPNIKHVVSAPYTEHILDTHI